MIPLAPHTPPIRLPELVRRLTPNRSDRVFHDRPRLIVVHDPEGGYSGAITTCLTPRGSKSVSYHVIVNEAGDEATQLVPWDEKAWHCKAFNDESIGVSMAGRLTNDPTVDETIGGYGRHQFVVTARIVAFLLADNGIPTRWVKPMEGDERKGFCRHRDLGIRGGGHTDPMDDAPWALFRRQVAFETQRAGFRKEWGIG